MTNPKQDMGSSNSRRETPSGAQKKATRVKGTFFLRFEQAAKKLFRSTAEGQDKTVSNTLAIVPHGSIGLLDHQAQQSANTASDYPCRKDISILTSTTSQASNAYPISETEELSSNSLSDVSQPWLSIFPQNITAPFPMVPLPPPGTLPETTAQLAFCNSLLRIRLSPSLAATASSNTFSDTAQQASVDAILYDSEEQGRIYELTIRVIEEFVADSLKTPEKIAEVILLGPYLDQEHHRTLLNCLIAEFESATLLDITLLQGIIQLVQCAEVEYLDPEDLARILNVLRTRLQDIHRQLTKYSYYLTLALSRFLDVMVDGKVQGLRRVVDHGSLSTLLNDLVTIPDPYLKYQAAYALQALLHIPYDETRRKFMLQQAGNVAMGLLGVASVCKLDLSELKGGVNHLYRPEGNIHDFPINGVSGDQSLLESDQGIATSVKEGVMSGGQQLWYAALREAQEYISNGRLADFNHLVFEAPCCQDIEFQWGVCHMLELIAVSSEWDVTSRQHAIKFLAELCRNKTWATNEEVVLWTLQPLHRIAAFSDPLLSDQAQFALQGLEKERDAAKEILYRNVISNPVNPYPTAAPMCAPLVSPLLAQALVVPHVEHDLHRLRVQRLNERENALYVPPQAKPTLQATNETLFPLMERVQQFIAGSGPVFLLLGDSGGGKSTFNIQLERTLWQDYKRGGTIPLLINLPAIDDPTQDLVAKQLRYYDFSEEQIQELKLLREFVLICDGYDEGQLEVNIHSANEFHKPEQWKVKMIISCRSQYLDVDYRSHFHPQPSSIYGHEVELMVEAVIAPFSEEQIEQYVGQYVKGLEKRSVIQSRAAWTLEEYMEKLTKIPNLMELVSNPFLLALSLGALPGLVELKKDLSAIRITRVLLYDGFVKHWIDVNKARLESSTLSDNERSEFYLILDDDFDYHSIRFQKNLAAAIFKEQEGQPMVSYNQFSDRKTWKSTFFSSDVHTKLLRESSTLTRSGDFFRFIHRSLQEYFYSRTVYDPFDYDPDSDRASIVDPKIALSHRNFVSEPSVLQFLAERVEMDTSFKAQLLGAIEDSKVDSTAGVAAANAISILIKADERFNGADLRGIRIPGADLRGGEFDSADLEGADLSNVNLTKAWLRQSNLRKVVLTGVQFGELPYITADNCVANVVFSFDGEYLAVSQDQGGINIFDTKTWNKIASYPGRVTIAASPVSQELAKTSVNHAVDVGDIFTGQPRLILRGHEDRVSCICYSSDGTRVATGSRDTNVRIWSTVSGETLHVLRGHSSSVIGVAFSPNGRQLVSCSKNRMVLVWNTETGKSFAELEGHDNEILCVAYSLDGRQIVGGGITGNAWLWDTYTMKVIHVLRGSFGSFYSVAYSPDGYHISFSADNGLVCLYDSHSGELLSTLSGHLFNVTSCAYSPSGHYIASGSLDKRVRLWRTGGALSDAFSDSGVEKWECITISPTGEQCATGGRNGDVQLWETLTGKPGVVLRGHTDVIGGLSFSPCEERIASNSRDGTVRQWCVQTGITLHVFNNPVGYLSPVIFSPYGNQIIAPDKDNNLQFWNAISGDPGLVLKGHTSRVRDMVYSPSGHQIASCSDDGTARLWNAETGEQLFALEHPQGVSELVYSPDKQELISTSVIEGTLRYWDPESGKHLGQNGIHDVEILGCCYSPDGKLTATASLEGYLQLWDRSTGDHVEVFRAEVGMVGEVKWKQGSKHMYLITVSLGCIRVWQLVKKEGAFELRLLWNLDKRELSLLDTNLCGAVGLSPIDLKLVEQRGAIVSSESDPLVKGE